MKEIEGYIAHDGKYLVIGYGKCHDEPVPSYPKEQQILQFLIQWKKTPAIKH